MPKTTIKDTKPTEQIKPTDPIEQTKQANLVKPVKPNSHNDNGGWTKYDKDVEQYRIIKNANRRLINNNDHMFDNLDNMAINDDTVYYIDENEIIIKAYDNGKGFNIDTSKLGKGLYSMKSRADSMKGKFDINTGKSNGCSITITIPTQLHKKLI